MGDQHGVVFQPNEVLPIAAVRGQDMVALLMEEPGRHIPLQVPIGHAVNSQFLQPAALDLQQLLRAVRQRLNVRDKLYVLAIVILYGLGIA